MLPAVISDKVLFGFSGWTVDLGRYLLIDTDGAEQRLSAIEATLLGIFLRRPNRLIIVIRFEMSSGIQVIACLLIEL